MKRDELRALGVPENAVDQVYELCRKHMAKLKRSCKASTRQNKKALEG